MHRLLTGIYRNSMLLILAFSLCPSNVRAVIPEEKQYSYSDLIIHTVDNVTIRGRLFDNENDRVIIYCHPLLGSQKGEEVQPLLDAFIDDFDLITFNFRGHKSSGWRSTAGGDEVLDLRAVISFAVKKGYDKIVVLGAGIGSSVAIRTAGIFRNIDALIVISPSFSPENQPFLIRMTTDITLNTDFGRVPLRILTNTRLGTRSTGGYPIDIIDSVSPIPLLIIQSENDRVVDLSKFRDALGRGKEPGKLVVVPGRRHANKLLVKSTLTEIVRWLNDVIPDRTNGDDVRLGEDPVYDYPAKI